MTLLPWHGRPAHAFFFAAMVFSATAFSADSLDRAAVLATFELHPDFQIELVAAEPQVFSPVDVEFDEHGRPFVMEMMGYPFPNDPGRVITLDDKNNDGIYETRTVFADNLGIANSLMVYNGGILVIAPPDILFLKDTNGDNVADVREVVVTGLTVANPEDSINNPVYGLDNWIYCANGGNSGDLKWPDSSDVVPLRSDDLRFDPRHKHIERASRAVDGYGLTFDNWGRMFTTNHTGPAFHHVFPGTFIEGLPQPPGGTLKSLPDDLENGLVRLYPIGEQVTRLNHPEQSGYFSGACSVTHYGGGAFGPAFDGNLFICDVVLNLVHRRILEPSGTTFTAHRDDRAKAEFLAATDRAFRPVNMTVAPDGSLWVVDMHRVIIEHPEWIPDDIEKTLDLNAGKNQGRLFRITPKAGLPRIKPDFRRNDIASVVTALESPNQWWRTTAQRLLVEWNDKSAMPLLERLARESKIPVARAHALWTLDGLGKLDDSLVAEALDHPSAELREVAMQLAVPRMNSSKKIAARVAQPEEAFDQSGLPWEKSMRVRMWTALALAEYDGDRMGLSNIVRKDAGDPFMNLALLPALVRDRQINLELLLKWRNNDIEFASRLAQLIEPLAQASVSRLDSKHVATLFQIGAEESTIRSGKTGAFLRGFATGLASDTKAFQSADDHAALTTAIAPLLTVESLPTLREAWRVARALELDHVPGQEEALTRAEAAVHDATLSNDLRVQNLQILEFAPFTQRADLLYSLLDTHQPRELQREAIQQLQRVGTPAVAERLIAMWRLLGPETRPIAGNILLYQRANHKLLLSALEDSTISLAEMNFHLERRRALLFSKDPEVVRRAEALFSDSGVVTRKDAIEKMKPALALTGNPLKGKETFMNLCSKCHTKNGEGGDVAPNLTEIYRKSRETIMNDILDPNAAADKQYIAYTIERNNGELVSGLIAEETDDAVTIRDANGVRTTVPRGDIKEMLSNGLSLMPEELETGLDPQAFADLLAFLQERT